jgi:uncharacterized PurR-regulated membrane protein YhhQ (DUF165 family)
MFWIAAVSRQKTRTGKYARFVMQVTGGGRLVAVMIEGRDTHARQTPCHRGHYFVSFASFNTQDHTAMKFALLYIASLVLVNFAFDRVPLVPLPGGEMWPPVSLFVGFIFVVRDYAQREIGHYVLPCMLVGGAISWFMSTPAIALASLCAFLTSELMDWAVYTFTRRPFSQRVLLSSALSTPVDSVVFLVMIDMFSIASVLMMTVSKMIGALVVFYLARRREHQLAEAAR